MDASELAMKMLEWEKQIRANNVLGAEIEAEVLCIGKTQVVGKCRVTYRGGTASYDYETPARFAPQEIIDKWTEELEVTDWSAVADEAPDVVRKFTSIEKHVDYRSVLKDAKIEPVVISRTDPTATIKLDE